MKKFKLGDTIRLKADGLTSRTYEVVSVDNGVANGQRNDDRAGDRPHTFVLGRPEEYKLLHRPTKKDREIKVLQRLVKEAQDAERSSRRRAEAQQVEMDMALLEAGLVRLDLLREASTRDVSHYGDGLHEFANIKLVIKGDVIRTVLQRWFS